MQLFVQLIVILLWIVSIGWITGKKSYPIGPNDDERKRSIKSKSIIQSWTTLLLFLVTNYLFGVFNINEPAGSISETNLELFYIILALITYFIFYLVNSKKMSA
ncbi:hypothetical protein KJK41_20135 [Bacillus haikouensis]|jgi:hypothetical protein|nr:hypothetical protein KJK41_20135 [Bacillus haikouensis]